MGDGMSHKRHKRGDFYARFPYAPIEPFLRRKGLELSRMQQLDDNGIRALSRFISYDSGQAPDVVERALSRAPHTGTICCHNADQWARALGYHPGDIWGWDEYLAITKPKPSTRPRTRPRPRTPVLVCAS